MKENLKKIIEIIAIVGISIFFSFLFWGENLKAKWWAIDDHEVMMFLGDDGKVNLKEIPTLLLEKTEVGKWGESTRFRPSYYFLRICESMLWRNNSFLWYFSRIVISASLFIGLWHGLKPYLGFWYAGLIPLAMYCYSYWVDIFTRLGPGEIYTVIGFAMFFWGFIRQIEVILGKRELKSFMNKLSSFFLGVGAIICIGSKENFIFLVGLLILLTILMFVKQKFNWWLFVNSLLVIIFSIYVYSSLFIALSSTGVDVYNEEISLKQRLILTYEHIPFVIDYFKLELLLICTSIFSFIILFLKGISGLKKYLVVVFGVFSLIITLLLLYLSQYFFYNGVWPTEMRYDFPGLICEIFYLVVVLLLLYKSLREIDLSESFSKTVINICVLITFVMLQPLIPFGSFKQSSLSNVARTADFTNRIESVVSYCKEHPGQPLIYESYSVWDYEPIVSVDRFLKAYGVKNPIYLKLNGYSPESFVGGLKKKLTEELNSASLNGGIVADSASFEMLDVENLDKCNECILLNFSGGETTSSISFRMW